MNILIIGGNSDIGIQIARKFYQNNENNLYLTIQPNKELNIDINQFINHKDRIKIIEFDLLDYKSHKEFFNQLNPKPRLVVCAAGFFLNDNQISSDFNLTKKIINTNFVGYVSILEIIIEEFKRKNKGSIIGISSVAGERGRASNFTYGSSKAAFSAYLSGLRNSIKDFNIQIMTVKPGFIATKMTKELKFNKYLISTPEIVAKDIYKAWKKKKDTIYTPWYWEYIILILKLIPEKIFKKLNL